MVLSINLCVQLIFLHQGRNIYFKDNYLFFVCFFFFLSNLFNYYYFTNVGV